MKNKRHSYDVDAASRYGIFDAIVLNYFIFYIDKSANLADHNFDGSVWTYATQGDMEKEFPEFTKEQIRYTMRRLTASGVLIKGSTCYVNNKKTTWYTVDFGVLERDGLGHLKTNCAPADDEQTPEPKPKYHHQAEDFKKYPFCPQFNDYGKPLYFNDEARAMADNLVERYTIDALMKFRERYPKVTESTMVEFLDMLYFNKDAIKSYMPQKEVSSW